MAPARMSQVLISEVPGGSGAKAHIREVGEFLDVVVFQAVDDVVVQFLLDYQVREATGGKDRRTDVLVPRLYSSAQALPKAEAALRAGHFG